MPVLCPCQVAPPSDVAMMAGGRESPCQISPEAADCRPPSRADGRRTETDERSNTVFEIWPSSSRRRRGCGSGCRGRQRASLPDRPGRSHRPGRCPAAAGLPRPHSVAGRDGGEAGGRERHRHQTGERDRHDDATNRASHRIPPPRSDESGKAPPRPCGDSSWSGARRRGIRRPPPQKRCRARSQIRPRDPRPRPGSVGLTAPASALSRRRGHRVRSGRHIWFVPSS